MISGNAGDGIEFEYYSIRGNRIGTNVNGAPLPNGGNGVLMRSGSPPFGTSRTVGGTLGLTHGACTGDCNLIVSNGAAGVAVSAAGTRQAVVRGNSIRDNAGLGMDLGPVGVTPNDPDDADTGANDLQNFPVLTSAINDGVSTTVSGVLDSTPSTAFTIDFYDSATADGAGHGEAAAWLGSAAATTDGGGDAAFTAVLPGLPRFLSATATGPGGTSEFSAVFFNPGEASPAGTMTAHRGGGSALQVSYQPACGAVDHAVYAGMAGPGSGMTGGPGWSKAWCGLGTSGVASLDPGDPTAGALLYFVIVGQTSSSEGSYGRDSAHAERAEAQGVGVCDRGLSLTQACP